MYKSESSPSLKEQEGGLQKLEERREKAKTLKRKNNAYSRAGSLMYYYCKLCGLVSDELPEMHSNVPKKHCEDCQNLLDSGYSPEKGEFIKFVLVNCSRCNGKGNLGFIGLTAELRTCPECNGNGKIPTEVHE